MLEKISTWIDETNTAYAEQKQCCNVFSSAFAGFYSKVFLSKSFFVVTEELPKPHFPELFQAGLGDFINMDADGITYKNVYYIKPDRVEDLSIHFHELVHVLQWQYLGAEQFITRYITEVLTNGYRSPPLEEMAYYLQDYFTAQKPALDVAKYVNTHLSIK